MYAGVLRRERQLSSTDWIFVTTSTTCVLASFVLIASELAIEPLYALNQYELNFRVRSTIESTAVFVKCLVTFVGVRLIKYYGTKNSSGWAVLSFLAGQLGYALVNVVGYLYHFKFRIPKVTKIQQKGNAFSSIQCLRSSTIHFPSRCCSSLFSPRATRS